MKQIPLTRGQTAFVDDADYEWLNQWKWYAAKDKKGKFYARRKVYVMGKKITVQMHREILNPGAGIMTDHRDGNGLNNQRLNLRSCNHQQNNMNRNITRGASRYKGVYWHKTGKKWNAKITINKKTFHIGTFTDEADAARAYDAVAMERFGEYARINFPCNS